jgi:glycopeptide antibiotics resistance protein
MSKKVVLLLLFVVVIAVFYYSWLSDPSLSSESYLPKWLLKWSNRYYNVRTAVPFVAFGFLLEAYSKHKRRYEVDVHENLIFIQNLGVAAVVAFIAEGGQFLIKNRSPDIMDIYFGIIGSLIGGLVHLLYNKVSKD